MTLRQIVQALRETYCGTDRRRVHARHRPGEKRWWQERLEKHPRKPSVLSADDKSASSTA